MASSSGMFTFPLRKIVPAQAFLDNLSPAQAFSDNQERLVSSSIKTAVEQRTASKSQRNN